MEQEWRSAQFPRECSFPSETPLKLLVFISSSKLLPALNKLRYNTLRLSSQGFKLCHVIPRNQFQRPKNHILRSLTAMAPLPSAALSEVITLFMPVTKHPKAAWGRNRLLRVQGDKNILLTDRSINWLVIERWERDRQISNKKEIWIKERLVDWLIEIYIYIYIFTYLFI